MGLPPCCGSPRPLWGQLRCAKEEMENSCPGQMRRIKQLLALSKDPVKVTLPAPALETPLTHSSPTEEKGGCRRGGAQPPNQRLEKPPACAHHAPLPRPQRVHAQSFPYSYSKSHVLTGWQTGEGASQSRGRRGGPGTAVAATSDRQWQPALDGDHRQRWLK